MNLLHTILPRVVIAAAALLTLAAPAQAQHAGLRSFTIAGDAPTTVALFYPTTVPGRVLAMGPWQPLVAPGAPASAAPLKGLILLSHGTGGTELNHHNLGTRLASEGYLVAAVRHAGDNWQDRSLIASGRYFSERPRQLSRVLDALLASPEWGARIPADRIGAVGHSAGGYSVLALAGAQAEPARAAQHCRTVRDDPGFCTLASTTSVGPAGSAPVLPPPAAVAAAAPPDAPLDAPLVSVADQRIRAAVVVAPMAVVLTPQSLAAIRVPVRVLIAEQDRVLQTPYHGGHVLAHLPGAQGRTVAGAGHFAFMAQATVPLPSPAGDAAGNPPGFDRPAFLAALDDEVAGFFAAQWP